MITALKKEIKRLSKRAFEKQKQKEDTEEAHRQKFKRRTGLIAGNPNIQPNTLVDRHYDPKYCARNANFLAKTIWYKVTSKTYEPKPAIQYLIPKADGTNRTIMAFSIPDAALANIILRRARDRNLKRLSPSSFAYHPNKNVFDAILSLREFQHDGKSFAVQIDFKKYFDTIPATYLKKIISDKSYISLTPHEKYIFDRFLHHRFATLASYQKCIYKRRHKGTPQGSSVSLLLANLANHDLDVSLSAQPGKFVRFADDVVALCSNYEQSQKLESCFIKHCDKSGLELNLQKSPGVAIISHTQQEMRTYSHFDYLGYRFSNSGLGVPQKVGDRIRSRISRLTNIYLIQYLQFGFNPNRTSIIPPIYDWDLLGLAYELRRSIYGGLSEGEITSFLQKGQRLRKMKGLMGFYCLIDDPAELKSIDGWMLSIVRRALVQRNEILLQKYQTSCATPNNRSLATGEWLDLDAWDGADKPETRFPSLVRGWRAARKHYFTFGLEGVEAPDYNTYSSIGDFFDYK